MESTNEVTQPKIETVTQEYVKEVTKEPTRDFSYLVNNTVRPALGKLALQLTGLDFSFRSLPSLNMFASAANITGKAATKSETVIAAVNATVADTASVAGSWFSVECAWEGVTSIPGKTIGLVGRVAPGMLLTASVAGTAAIINQHLLSKFLQDKPDYAIKNVLSYALAGAAVWTVANYVLSTPVEFEDIQDTFAQVAMIKGGIAASAWAINKLVERAPKLESFSNAIERFNWTVNYEPKSKLA